MTNKWKSKCVIKGCEKPSMKGSHYCEKHKKERVKKTEALRWDIDWDL